jgi:hypothetical protein
MPLLKHQIHFKTTFKHLLKKLVPFLNDFQEFVEEFSATFGYSNN